MKFVRKLQSARLRRVRRLRALIGAGFLATTGLILTVTPIPFGAPVFASGVAMLSATDRGVRRLIMGLRNRSRLLNHSLRALATGLPAQSKKLLRLTDPETYRKRPSASPGKKSSPAR